MPFAVLFQEFLSILVVSHINVFELQIVSNSMRRIMAKKKRRHHGRCEIEEKICPIIYLRVSIYRFVLSPQILFIFRSTHLSKTFETCESLPPLARSQHTTPSHPAIKIEEKIMIFWVYLVLSSSQMEGTAGLTLTLRSFNISFLLQFVYLHIFYDVLQHVFGLI